MRLLKREQNAPSGFSLVDFRPTEIPSVYAILSHRWGPEEVTFRDLDSDAAKTKQGYRKLDFCAERAAVDGIIYFWIDTCCIDKANNTELSEAINSMFQWYQRATKCYVYLSDVLIQADNETTSSEPSWGLSFQSSEWFKRGWTLQELLAPPIVEFFSVEGEQLGSKTSLDQLLHRITGIPVKALQGSALIQFSIDERFAWSTGRLTTIEEDSAYCLLGIFDVHMPLLYGEGRQKALARLRRKVEKSSPAAGRNTTNATWVVPFERNPRFLGREVELAKLEANLYGQDSTSRWAITGLGGVGKTQLVLELLYRIRAKQPDCRIMWVPATSPEALHQGYSAVARELNIEETKDEKTDVKILVRQYLNNVDRGRWLLVFDNADDLELWTTTSTMHHQDAEQNLRLLDCIPQNRRGCVVFTTRDRKAATKLAGPNIITVSEMNADVAMELLGKYLHGPSLADHQEDAVRFLAELSFLPLAIVQAATYIIENEITLAEYLCLLEEQEEEVISLLSEDFEDLGRYRDVKNPIATTWLISFERIRKCDGLAAEYLSFIACVHPKDIPRSLLPEGPSRRRQMEAIGTLTAYSFVTKRPTCDTLEIHRLVHLAMRSWLRKEQAFDSWLARTVTRLEEVFPSENHTNVDTWRLYLPHALQVLESDSVRDGCRTEVLASLMTRCGRCLSEDGRTSEAETMLSRVLTWQRTYLTEDDPDILANMSWLASTYADQERWVDAEHLHAQVLETRKKTLGAEHADVLKAMKNLAVVYSCQWRLVEAEELLVRALELSKLNPKADDTDVVIMIRKLAGVLSLQARYEEAQEQGEKAVAMAKTKLGSDHQYTIASMNTLATVMWCLGRLDEAEDIDVQVLKARRKMLGDDHPDTMLSMDNLVATYGGLERFEEAEELAAHVVKTRKVKQGIDHPATLLSMSNLACVWKDMGRTTEAIVLMKDCVERQNRFYGGEYPKNVVSRQKLREWEAELSHDGQTE